MKFVDIQEAGEGICSYCGSGFNPPERILYSFDETEHKLCGDCLLRKLLDLVKERKVIILDVSHDEDWKEKLPQEVVKKIAWEEL